MRNAIYFEELRPRSNHSGWRMPGIRRSEIVLSFRAESRNLSLFQWLACMSELMPPSERWTHITRNHAERYVLARIQRQLKRVQKHFPLWKYKTWPRAERAARNWVRKFSPTLPAVISSKNRM